MNRFDISERFAHMWKHSREITGKSQDYMAKALGVSKKTVQNWEMGTSCPSQLKGFEWFDALGLNPLPFYLRLLHPDKFTGLQSDHSEKRTEDALIQIIKDLPPDSKRKLLYLLCGDHGSSVVGMLELINAHLQSPLRDRLNIAQSVAINYEIAVASGKIRKPEQIQPDMEVLDDAIRKGKAAVISGRENYITII